MDIVVDGFIYRRQAYGGVSRIFDHLIPGLCRLDPSIHVRFLLDGKPLKPIPRGERISLIDMTRWDRWMWPKALLNKRRGGVRRLILRALLGSTRDKVWMSTYYRSPSFEWKGRQVVLTHDLIHELFPDLFPTSVRQSELALKKTAFSRAGRILCVSATTAQDFAQYYPLQASKLRVITIACDPSFRLKADQDIAYRLERPFLLYIGRRSAYKGFETLLNAYSRWPGRRAVRLLVVGEEWSPKEAEFLSEHALQDRVVLLPHLSDDQLCDLYNQAAAFVFPSLYEGFGIPLLEALACGCPIVASDIPVAREVAAGVPDYFQPADEAGLIDALDRAVAGGPSAGRREEGLDLARQRTWEQASHQVWEALQAG